MSDVVLSRRERERIVRRDEILSAARSVFAEKGFARATLDEIAARAEFGKGTLYNYFEGGKDALLEAILDELFDEMVDIVENAFVRSTTFRAALHSLVKEHMELFSERRELFIIMMKEVHRMMLSDDPSRSDYVRHQQSRVIGALVPHLARAQIQGHIRDGHCDALAHTIFGNIQGVQMHVCVQGCVEGCLGEPVEASFSPTIAADFITSILLDGLAHRENIDSNITAP
jgi:TetR/AcrR family transcriptional regulator, repressor of fatR-cypB operon